LGEKNKRAIYGTKMKETKRNNHYKRWRKSRTEDENAETNKITYFVRERKLGEKEYRDHNAQQWEADVVVQEERKIMCVDNI